MVFKFTLKAVAVVAALMAFAGTALADAPDPIPSATHGTVVVNADGSRTLTVWGGTDATNDPGWRWTTHGSDCNNDRSGAGFAIAWNDPTDQGNEVDGAKGNPNVFVGTTADNTVHSTPQMISGRAAAQDVSDPTQFADWRSGCGLYVNHGPTTLPDGSVQSGNWSQGTWGPISHTYPASVTGPLTICPIMYDVHGKQSGTAPNGAKEITAGGKNLNGDNSIQDNANTPQGNGCFTSTFNNPHPAIDVQKTAAESSVDVGGVIHYTVTITNTGDVDLTVTPSDTGCDGFNGAAFPLAAGASTTLSCTHTATASDGASYTNQACANGTDAQGDKVSDCGQVTTPINPPGQQAVLGTRVTPGAARLLGPTGCVSKTFSARVKGTKVASVTFRVDGKVVKKFTKTLKSGNYAIRVNPAKFRVGVHRLVATVTFAKGTGTKTKTLRLSFQRCGKRLVAPRFTG